DAMKSEQADLPLKDRIINASKEELNRLPSELLKLAMVLYFPGIIPIILSTPMMGDTWDDYILDYALYDAIRLDSVTFVDILVEYGATFENLRRDKIVHIDELYQDHVSIMKT
ncbi:unnamed protein product, partial [Didymodactylos carnosus]